MAFGEPASGGRGQVLMERCTPPGPNRSRIPRSPHTMFSTAWSSASIVSTMPPGFAVSLGWDISVAPCASKGAAFSGVRL